MLTDVSHNPIVIDLTILLAIPCANKIIYPMHFILSKEATLRQLKYNKILTFSGARIHFLASVSYLCVVLPRDRIFVRLAHSFNDSNLCYFVSITELDQNSRKNRFSGLQNLV
jgi:hypothetical protein